MSDQDAYCAGCGRTSPFCPDCGRRFCSSACWDEHTALGVCPDIETPEQAAAIVDANLARMGISLGGTPWSNSEGEQRA